jgi:segregation and condensation protein A
MTHDYNVKLETFEGPLPLLLDLVEKRKLFINEISLAMIADDYIAHLKSFEKMPVDFV